MRQTDHSGDDIRVESFLDYLDAQFLETSQAEGWQPQTDREADWALQKIRQAAARVAAKQAERADALKDLDAWVEKETRQALHHQVFFEAKLRGYLLHLRETGRLGRQKGYDLPSGRLQFRSLKDKYEPTDKVALLAWAEEHGHVKVKIEPDMERIRQICVEGQDVPGMSLVRQAHEAFSVILGDNHDPR